jgi:hypothetical protein
MKKLIFLIVLIAPLVLTGIDCFAQSTDAQAGALQGEWAVISMQMGDRVIYESSMILIEIIWKFEGNNYSFVTTNLKTGESEILAGTFIIAGDTLVITYQGEIDVIPYTLQGNNLTMTADYLVFFSRKQMPKNIL